ncbi:MAG: HEAT repeat domain-containing protein, partial [Rhodothermales bacterium]
ASDDITVRNLAGEVLIQIGEPSIPALAPAIDDPDHDVRKFAIDVLAQLPAQGLTEQIAAHLHDEDDNVVLAAVDALGDLGASQHRDDLRALYHREPLARPSIVAALGVFEQAADLDLLEQALVDEDPVVQYTAAEALARQDAPEVLDLLLRKVDEVHPMARPVMLSSIVNCCEAHSDGAHSFPASIKGYLQEMLEDSDLAYRCAAVRGLKQFLDSETIGSLLACAGQNDTLDVEIFKVLALCTDVFRQIERAVDAGNVSAGSATGFVLGFVAQQVIAEEEYEDVRRFLEVHFDTLDAETKIAAIGLSQNLQHPILFDIIRVGQADPDMEVSAFAADAAYAIGLGAGPEASEFTF